MIINFLFNIFYAVQIPKRCLHCSVAEIKCRNRTFQNYFYFNALYFKTEETCFYFFISEMII